MHKSTSNSSDSELELFGCSKSSIWHEVIRFSAFDHDKTAQISTTLLLVRDSTFSKADSLKMFSISTKATKFRTPLTQTIQDLSK